MHLNPSSNELIGNMIIKLAADHLPEGGDVAVLSASATATNQNTWIEEMNKVLPNYPGINVVATVYGDDLSDKSYREAQGLMAVLPGPQGDHRPDLGRHRRRGAGGRPTPARSARSTSPASACRRRWRGTSRAGASKSFAIWNPIDLGYAATMIAYNLATDKATAEPGAEIPMGRMGAVKLDETNEGAMADPFVYDASNIDEFKSIF